MNLAAVPARYVSVDKPIAIPRWPIRGAMREIHWHPDPTSGNIILSGHAVVHPYPAQNKQRPTEG
jgi:hypothetical protein